MYRGRGPGIMKGQRASAFWGRARKRGKKMELALITTQKIVEMFLIMLAGVLIVKTGMGSHQTGKDLSAILLKIVIPCMIIMAYQVELDAQLLQKLALAAALSALSMAAGILIARVAVPESADSAVERMAAAYSNCGFIGIPLAGAVLGEEGVLYITAYMLVYNIFAFTHGVMLMSGRAGSLKDTLRSLCQPALIAILVSLLMLLFQVRLPEVLASPLGMLRDMNTPAAMLVSGINLAESDILGSLRRPGIYKITALKLLIIPAATLLLLRLLRPDPVIALTVLIGAACPAGATGTMFALQYHKDSRYFSELLALSTLVSLVSIPLMVLAGSLLLG